MDRQEVGIIVVLVLLFGGMSAAFFYEAFKARKEYKACVAAATPSH